MAYKVVYTLSFVYFKYLRTDYVFSPVREKKFSFLLYFSLMDSQAERFIMNKKTVRKLHPIESSDIYSLRIFQIQS